MQGAPQEEFTDFDFKHVCWDSLRIDEWRVGHSNRPYQQRFGMLAWNKDKDEIAPTWFVRTLEEVYAIYSQHTSKGLEGVVIKNPDAPFKDGTSKDCVKLKLKFSCDYAVIGYYEGEGKYKGMLGGLTIATSCGKLVTNVGTGLSDKQRKELWEVRDMLAGKIVEVSANDVIASREKSTISLSLPAFEEIRTDKNVADSLEMVYNQLNSTKQGN